MNIDEMSENLNVKYQIVSEDSCIGVYEFYLLLEDLIGDSRESNLANFKKNLFIGDFWAIDYYIYAKPEPTHLLELDFDSLYPIAISSTIPGATWLSSTQFNDLALGYYNTSYWPYIIAKDGSNIYETAFESEDGSESDQWIFEDDSFFNSYTWSYI